MRVTIPMTNFLALPASGTEVAAERSKRRGRFRLKGLSKLFLLKVRTTPLKVLGGFVKRFTVLMVLNGSCGVFMVATS
jgi:hypothetical protein